MAFNYSPKPVIDSSLVLYLDAANSKSYVSGSTTWNDISRGGNNGTLVNGPTYSSANGGSIVFNGTTQYANIENSNSLNITEALTLSAWIFQTSWSGYPAIISKGYDTTGGYSMHIRDNNSIWFEIDGTGTRYTYNPTNILITNNTWYNIVSTYDKSLMRIYINAAAVGNGYPATQSIKTTTDNLWIGRLPGFGFFSGRIANTQIYNRALSQAEITQNFNATKGRYGL